MQAVLQLVLLTRQQCLTASPQVDVVFADLEQLLADERHVAADQPPVSRAQHLYFVAMVSLTPGSLQQRRQPIRQRFVVADEIRSADADGPRGSKRRLQPREIVFVDELIIIHERHVGRSGFFGTAVARVGKTLLPLEYVAQNKRKAMRLDRFDRL